MISERSVVEWPGTRLLAASAVERRYRIDDDSIRLLSDNARSLFAWLQPALPEELAFYRRSDECWLFSIAHERVACVDTRYIDATELGAAIPGIYLRRQRRQF